MQQVTISGTLLSDAENCVDKNQRSYIRFTVTCGDNDENGRSIYTHYRCTCYIAGYEKMKKGDQVFVTGKQKIRLGQTAQGEPKINIDVMVFQISGGRRADQRNTR
ncbi:MAG: single-stranded DNA-binding protein [Bacteroidales bacterium]|nr:single-stranded DNA-binding protein [Bacteroidales bacterium]